MKTKYTTAVSAVALGLILSTASLASADEKSQAASFKEMLRGVPAPELPAQSAKLVSQAKAKEQKSVTVGVVGAAVEKNPLAAPFIVSAVAKRVPSVAGIAAATAASMEPKQAGAIAKAAASAAPSQAANIVFAMCKELPGSYPIIAIGASEAVPGADEDILAAVSRAIPSMKPFIEQANNTSSQSDGFASRLVGIIQNAQNLASASGSTTPLVEPPPPGNGGPFVPGTQGNGDPQRKQTVIVQPGTGRLYSGP